MIKVFTFWIYRSRDIDEAEAESIDAGRREFQALPRLLEQNWPGLRFRVTPAPGAGIQVTVKSNPGVTAPAIRRYLDMCIQERNRAAPSARLQLGS